MMTEQMKDLQTILASTYSLMIKTHNFHWNIEGPNFYSDHKLLEMQYEELFKSVDEIAETIRTYNVKAVASLKDFLTMSIIADGDYNNNRAEMISILADDNKMLANLITEILEGSTDETIISLLGDRLKAHHKAQWMLSSSL